MRILSVTQSYAPFYEFGGPPVKVRALAEGLTRMGHEVHVLTADWGLDKRTSELADEPPGEPNPFGRKRTLNGVTAIYLANWLHYRATSWNPALGRYLRARLKTFDVVHIFGLYDLLGPRVAKECRARKIPYVVEPIGMFVPMVRNLRLKKIYHRFWGRELLAGASRVIATAEIEKAGLVAGGIPAEKIILRRNGVDAPASFPERGIFRSKQRIPGGAKLVLFLGRLSQKKSPEMLLKAFVQLRASGVANPEAVHLAFAGPDEAGMLDRLQEAAVRAGIAEYVHFSGALSADAKWAAYRDADIFVLPSQNENFGNTAAEAVAAGTPVILTDQCGIAPLLAGRAGLVIRHDEAELAGALAELLGNRALHAALKAGCREVLQKLGWDEPLLEMDALFKTLAEPRSA